MFVKTTFHDDIRDADDAELILINISNALHEIENYDISRSSCTDTDDEDIIKDILDKLKYLTELVEKQIKDLSCAKKTPSLF